MKRRPPRDWAAFAFYVALLTWIVPAGIIAGWWVSEITGVNPLSVWAGGGILLGFGFALSLSQRPDGAATPDPTPPASDQDISNPGVVVTGDGPVNFLLIPPMWLSESVFPDGVRTALAGQFRTLAAILRGGPPVWLGRRHVALPHPYAHPFLLAGVYFAILYFSIWFLLFWLLVAAYS